MAKEGGIKTRGKTPKIIAIMVIMVVFAGFAFTYMLNHYSTEELMKFALLKYFLFK